MPESSLRGLADLPGGVVHRQVITMYHAECELCEWRSGVYTDNEYTNPAPWSPPGILPKRASPEEDGATPSASFEIAQRALEAHMAEHHKEDMLS